MKCTSRKRSLWYRRRKTTLSRTSCLTRRSKLAGAATLLGLVAFGVSGCSSGSPSAATKLGVWVTPVHGGGTSGLYHSGELLNISVGPNKLFTPNLKVNILECSDPGGSPAHLPTSVAQCDGNTIQGGTILIQSNGSVSHKAYPVFSLPNHVLGEEASWKPVCDATHECVLYVGENQEKFTSPKLFSAPFKVDLSK
jgi:hypothetical protein